MPQNSKTVAVA